MAYCRSMGSGVDYAHPKFIRAETRSNYCQQAFNHGFTYLGTKGDCYEKANCNCTIRSDFCLVARCWR